MLRPKSSSAGDTPMSGAGVFRWRSNAFATASVSRDPVGLTFDVRMRFIVLTALSARPLLSGKYADDKRWCIPQFRRNVLTSLDSYGGPPSDESSSGTPKVVKYFRSTLITLVVVVFEECLRQATSVHQENRSA